MHKQNVRSERPTSPRSAARWPDPPGPRTRTRRLVRHQPATWPRDPHPDSRTPPLGGADAQAISPDEARRIVDKIEF